MSSTLTTRSSIARSLFATLLVCSVARAELKPDWISHLPVGTSLDAGLHDMVVDSAGVTYVTGVTGPSYNRDVVTAAFGADGSLLWSKTFDGSAQWHDQASGIALGPNGVLYVTGSTPDSNFFANVLVLAYDSSTGDLLKTVQFSSGPFLSESGGSVVADGNGNVYVGGSTVGDGGDALILALDSDLKLRWKKHWDGPADAPYSQDSVLQVQLAPGGELVALIHGVMATLHPDYVVVKYDSATGADLWEATWGSNGEDWPIDMAIDETGDIFVTGSALQGSMQYGTIRLRAQDGSLAWEAYDTLAFHNRARALALDAHGGVFVTGSIDPDGDESNQNDNFFTIKRDAASGAFQWSHLYGSNTRGHFDLPSDVSVDPDGHVFLSGITNSQPYSVDAITFVLDAETGLEVERGVVSGGSTEMVTPRVLRFDASHNVYNGSATYDFNTGEIKITVFRYPSMVGSNGSFIDLGHGLSGNYAPRLEGSGSLKAHESFTLSFTELPPAESGPLFIGLSLISMPFKGGTLLPAPDVILFFATGTGAFDLPGSLPSGVPSGFSLYLQAWFPDSGAPQGLCATNGLQLITP